MKRSLYWLRQRPLFAKMSSRLFLPVFDKKFVVVTAVSSFHFLPLCSSIICFEPSTVPQDHCCPSQTVNVGAPQTIIWPLSVELSKFTRANSRGVFVSAELSRPTLKLSWKCWNGDHLAARQPWSNVFQTSCRKLKPFKLRFRRCTKSRKPKESSAKRVWCASKACGVSKRVSTTCWSWPGKAKHERQAAKQNSRKEECWRIWNTRQLVPQRIIFTEGR